jgi:hypothetical protein
VNDDDIPPGTFGPARYDEVYGDAADDARQAAADEERDVMLRSQPHIGPVPADVLDAIDGLLAKWVAFPSVEARWAVTLWVAHCHVIDAFDSTPRLALLSPEKGSGKTRCLEVLDLLVPSPMHAVSMSAAALFRLVADRQPTILLDEADTYLGPQSAKQHEELRGLINAGHRKGAVAYRCDTTGKNPRPVEYPAFAAVAVAGIGDLPDTILDRAVVVAMKRRSRDEQLDPFRQRHARLLAEPVKDALVAWAEGAAEALADVWPELPDELTDRAADVWEPLVAIADVADVADVADLQREGDTWPVRARQAALALDRARRQRDPSLGVLLLTDCHRVFTTNDVDRMSTDDLLEQLNKLEESPWGNLRGKALDARGLARRLRRFDVRPNNVRLDDTIKKGYRVEDFADAWSRYLAVPTSGEPLHALHPLHDDEPDQLVFDTDQGDRP